MAQPPPRYKPGALAKDLVGMMYGFGDAEAPFRESVDVVEQLLAHHVEALCHDAALVNEIKSPAGKRIEPQSFLYTVRSQPRKFDRVMELLEMREKLKKVRKIDVDDGDVSRNA
ncbi:transcription initiation factor IID, 18kD subunit-domain-containing protein [Pelagophyceae sp. CCMP2097]|nr:transcription initiation factor IID, 18kD subunit-domain-containing protein [Pelagophyceae sp. CCMP2097]